MYIHNIPPVYDNNSRILILGSFPSVKSREARFYYGHPQNRFWKVLCSVYGEPMPLTIDEKITFLHKNGIALWDVIAECDIKGSADSSITNVKPNDLKPLLTLCPDITIFVNGRTAEKYYNRYMLSGTGIKPCLLPSTSPANAAYSTEKLVREWQSSLLCPKP